MIVDIMAVTALVFAFLTFIEWRVERRKRADFETDICGMIVRGEIDSRNLRRSLRHKTVRRAFDRRYSKDGTYEFLKEYKNKD